MQAIERSDDVLYFLCGGCGSELSVPVALHGIDGPCPCCGQTLRAPELALPPLPAAMVSLPPVDRRHETWQNTELIPEPEWISPETASAESWMPALGEASTSYVLPEAGKDRLWCLNDDPLAQDLGPSEDGELKAKLSPTSLPGPRDDSKDSSRALCDREVRGKKVARFTAIPGVRMLRVALLVITGGLCAALVLFLQDRHWVLDLPWQPDRGGSLTDIPALALPVLPARQVAPAHADAPNPFLPGDPSELEQITFPDVAAPVAVPGGAFGESPPIASGKK